MLVALLTYTLEVVAVGVVFAALRSSRRARQHGRRPLGGGDVIVTTLVWLVAQIIAATRSRQPLYDLPERTDPTARRRVRDDTPRLLSSGSQ